MRRTFALLAGTAALCFCTFAQAPSPVTPPPAGKGRIATRKANQQKRIAEGVKSGQLTPGETAKLEHKEARLNREIRHDRVDGGGLTPKERAKIERQQNRLSKDIAKQKHDAQHR